MNNRIIFGTACYLMGDVIRIRKRDWSTPLPNGKAWKQPYVATLHGIDLTGQFMRKFLGRTDRILNGVPAWEWYVPNGTMVEVGWCYDNVNSHDASTHYLIMIDGKWSEITKEQMIINCGGNNV